MARPEHRCNSYEGGIMEDNDWVSPFNDEIGPSYVAPHSHPVSRDWGQYFINFLLFGWIMFTLVVTQEQQKKLKSLTYNHNKLATMASENDKIYIQNDKFLERRIDEHENDPTHGRY